MGLKVDEAESLLVGLLAEHLRQVLAKWRREIKEQWARNSLGDSLAEARAQGRAEALREVIQMLRTPGMYAEEVNGLNEEESHEGM